MFTFSGFEFPTFNIASLGQFQQTDPFFNANEFLSFAQGAYLKIHAATSTGQAVSVRGLLSQPMLAMLENATSDPRWTTPVERIVQSSVLTVSHDNNVDTVTVRIAAQTTAKKKNQLLEDWTFTRPAANWGGLDAPPVTQCPSCGAPTTQLDDNGACHYCHVPIKGVSGDWRLVGVQLIDSKTAEPKSSGRGCWSGFWIFIILTTVVLPLVITGVILWFVHDTTNNAFGSFGSFGNAFTSTTAGPVKSILPTQGAMAGNVTMSSGLKGTFPVEDIAIVGGGNGSCLAKTTAATGLTVHSVGDGSNGVRDDVTITVTLPEGKKGPGTYPDATATVALVQAPSPGQTPTDALENSTWSGPATITLANNTGNVTMNGLAPADPKWSKFVGTVSFTCTG